MKITNIFRCLAVAFSLYSRIPMPMFNGKDSDMKYSLIFFPWVGIVIGGLTFAFWKLGLYLELPGIVIMLLLGLIPIVVTGGFHIDGFMDVEDARRSYADKNKKLEILKDPHIGAFAVIGLIKILLIYGVGLGILVYRGDSSLVFIYSLMFVISRCLSGVTAKLLPKAKKDGMLYEETKGNGHSVEVLLAVQFIVAASLMLLINWFSTVLMIAGLILNFIFYKLMVEKEFGGVTGDTAGYLLVTSETVMIIMLSISILI